MIYAKMKFFRIPEACYSDVDTSENWNTLLQPSTALLYTRHDYVYGLRSIECNAAQRSWIQFTSSPALTHRKGEIPPQTSDLWLESHRLATERACPMAGMLTTYTPTYLHHTMATNTITYTACAEALARRGAIGLSTAVPAKPIRSLRIKSCSRGSLWQRVDDTPAWFHAPVLAWHAFSKPFTVSFDGSKFKVGGVLHHEQIDGLHPDSYTSRKMNTPQR